MLDKGKWLLRKGLSPLQGLEIEEKLISKYEKNITPPNLPGLKERHAKRIEKSDLDDKMFQSISEI